MTKLAIKDLKPVKPEQDPTEALDAAVLNFLNAAKKKKRLVSVLEISDSIDRSPKAVQSSLARLRESGYNVAFDAENKLELASSIPKSPPQVINTEEYFGSDGWIRFGAIADTHLCSKYERLDVLNALYDVFAREGVKDVYHAGNWIDGVARFNQYDVKCIGIENQIRYFIQNYPQREGITTKIISGDDHEGWWVQREGVNIGKLMQSMSVEAGREDLVDLGYMERDIILKAEKGSATLRVMHAGGGSAYALSYTSQKAVESLQGGEKPAVVLVGHFHKFDHCYPREVDVVQLGCTQDQTPFMRKKRIQAMVGGCLIELKQDKRGVIVRRRVEWMPFYDKKFYQYKW